MSSIGQGDPCDLSDSAAGNKPQPCEKYNTWGSLRKVLGAEDWKPAGVPSAP